MIINKDYMDYKEKVTWVVKVLLILFAFHYSLSTASAQRLLTLDSCRAMALRNNKQIGISKLKQDMATNVRKSARTKYLPHASAIGSYEFTSEEVSILNDGQKAALGNMGTAFGQTVQQKFGPAIAQFQPQTQQLVGQMLNETVDEQKENLTHLGTNLATGIQQDLGQLTSMLPMEQIGVLLGSMGISLDALHQMNAKGLQDIATAIDSKGQAIVDALRSDTRNLFAGNVMLVQPVFMGGGIIALNKMADLGEALAKNSADAKRQATIYSTDQIYWQVVSLRHKQKLAESYLELVKKFDADVHKMIDEGVATKSDGLSVDVKVNEAEMTLTKVNDGLVLSKMLLCQTIGLPINEQITLADENVESLAVVELAPKLDIETAIENRPELRMLENTVGLTRQATNLLKAGNLPMVALTGGYMVSNPNLLNGFEKKFGGMWNVGVLVRVPIWNWGDVTYKVRAAKGATAIANLELEEAREKIELQVNQNTFRVDEANKRLTMAQANISRAKENLRTADLGFREGVITPTTVMEAQTAWLQAESQRIDAEIDVKLSQVDLQKSLGTLE